MTVTTSPICPACGFRVFNRRYPKCESCGTELPRSLVYSAAERRALIEAERQQARSKTEDQASTSGVGAASAAGEVAVTAAAYAIAALSSGSS